MTKAIPYSNAVAIELGRLHGTKERAQKFITRDALPARSEGAPTQHRVIIVSDLHLGAGRDPVTNRYFPGDDFNGKQERQFIAHMSAEWRAANRGTPSDLHPTRRALLENAADMKWPNGQAPDLSKLAGVKAQAPYALTLCINGDFIDFLQTSIERPGLRYPDGRTQDNKAPRNTPANALVQLNIIHDGHPEMFRALAAHLRLGHNIDMVPGNHDRHLWNEHVWSGEVEVDGKKISGFLPIMAAELRALGAQQSEIDACLARVRRLPFAVYADKWVEHGDMADDANRVQRPYKEAIDPTPLHEEMSMALGDYGVRGGFNQLEMLDPTLDAIDNFPRFVKQALRHPGAAIGLMLAFLRGSKQEGYTKSAEADMQTRCADVATLVDRMPALTEQLNALRPAGDKLSADDVKAGLIAIEKVSATPFFSNFKKGTSFLRRLLVMAKNKILGRSKDKPTDEGIVARALAAKQAFGVTGVVGSHTHQARDQSFLTEDEKLFRYINTHTWMDKVGAWGRPSVTWGEEGRGVGVIESGVDKYGQAWSELSLQKVVDEQGSLVAGDILDDAEDVAKSTEMAREVYSANHPPLQLPRSVTPEIAQPKKKGSAA